MAPQRLIPALPASGADTVEPRVLDALVNRVSTTAASFAWEGDDYVLDTARIGRDLRAFRARQGGNPLNLPAGVLRPRGRSLDEHADG